MTKVNLLLAEYMTKDIGTADTSKLEALQSIRELLSHINHNAEIVPEHSVNRYITMLTSLKGEPLSQAETRVAEEIINYG